MLVFYKQFSQGIAVAACSLMTISTLGYMLNDLHQIEKKQIKAKYDKEIDELKIENMMLKTKLKY